MSKGGTLMGKAIVVQRCISQCPLYTCQMNEMLCGHPDRVYEPYIITHENGRNGVPIRCPLRKQAYVQTITVLSANMLATNKPKGVAKKKITKAQLHKQRTWLER